MYKLRYVDLEKLMDSFIDDEDLIPQLIGRFFEDFPKELENIKKFIVAYDCENIVMSSHRLRSMVNIFFAEEIALKIEELENLARNNKLMNSDSYINDIEKLLLNLKEELNEINKNFT